MVEARAHLTKTYEPLLEFVLEHVPEGYRETPNFEIPAELRLLWKYEHWRLWAEVKASLQLWRLENDPAYRAYFNGQEIRRRARQAAAGWTDCAEQAELLFTQLSARGDEVLISDLVQLRAIIATIWDEVSKPTDKNRAIDRLAAIETRYDDASKRANERSEVEQRELEGTSIPELIRISQGGGESGIDRQE